MSYRIKYEGPGDDGQQIKDQGWRVYKASYHTHRSGRKIKRAAHFQKPRWKLERVFSTEEEAINYIKPPKSDNTSCEA